MKRISIRLAAFLLCLILLSGAMPSAVFAAEIARPTIKEVGMSIGADFGVHFYIEAPVGVSEVGESFFQCHFYASFLRERVVMIIVIMWVYGIWDVKITTGDFQL